MTHPVKEEMSRSIVNSDIIHTERLMLREFTLADCEFIVELLNTEGWIKYIGDRNVKTAEDARQYLENGPLKSYRDNVFGLRLVVLKSNNKPIGMCGLIRRDYLDHLDIGFAFLPNYTGQGYAFEIAGSVIHLAFNQLRQEKILAIVLPTNHSSVRLLAKIGFKHDHNFVSADTNEELSLYSITTGN
jgi:RimJ/RimL family protein N-acetyltransferase